MKRTVQKPAVLLVVDTAPSMVASLELILFFALLVVVCLELLTKLQTLLHLIKQ